MSPTGENRAPGGISSTIISGTRGRWKTRLRPATRRRRGPSTGDSRPRARPVTRPTSLRGESERDGPLPPTIRGGSHPPNRLAGPARAGVRWSRVQIDREWPDGDLPGFDEREGSAMTWATLDARSRPSAPALPGPIRRKLRRVDLRLRAASLLRGVGLVTLVAALGATLGMGADFAWPLSPTARWAISGAWLAATAAATVAAILRPLRRGRSDLELAALAERANPGLDERLTGAVALLDPRRQPHGSPALIAALADEAAAHVDTVDPARVVSLRRSALGMALGLAVLGMVAGPSALWPATYGTLIRRLLTPWADLDR